MNFRDIPNHYKDLIYTLKAMFSVRFSTPIKPTKKSNNALNWKGLFLIEKSKFNNGLAVDDLVMFQTMA